MPSRLPSISLLLIVSLLFAGCTPALNTAMMPKPNAAILESFEVSIAALNNDFGFDLYQNLDRKDKSVLISPASIAMALAMTYNGAGSETKAAMAEVLKIQGIDLDTLNKNNLALLYFLRTADAKVKLKIANSVWMRQGFAFDPDFISRNEKYYLAACEELDFAQQEAVETINKWVKDNTQGLIEKILEDPIDPMTIMFLINAVYFQGTWTKQFDKDLTHNGTFYTAGAQRVEVPMMFQKGDYDYYETNDFQAIRLPYGDEARMAMYVFLPAENSSLAEFEETLTNENWKKWLTAFTETEGNILLPRFSLEYEQSLNDSLKALGMELAFDSGRADFHAMVPGTPTQNIYIADVKHKTFIQVDEQGTEAAAVTSVEMGLTSMPLNFFHMEVNRPFFYVVHDSETEAILFMGSVLDPS